MSKEEGFAHIVLLFIIILVIIISILIFLGFQASRTLNLSSPQQSQYQNPFNQEAQYENPFETYQNPFNEINQ